MPSLLQVSVIICLSELFLHLPPLKYLLALLFSPDSIENALIQMFAEINADGGFILAPHILTGHTCTSGVLITGLPELRVYFLLVQNSFDGAHPFLAFSFCSTWFLFICFPAVRSCRPNHHAP